MYPRREVMAAIKTGLVNEAESQEVMTGLLPVIERGNTRRNGRAVVAVVLAARRRPAAGAQHDPVILAGSVQVVYPQDAPFEAVLQLGQGLRLDGLVGLDRT